MIQVWEIKAGISRFVAYFCIENKKKWLIVIVIENVIESHFTNAVVHRNGDANVQQR